MRGAWLIWRQLAWLLAENPENGWPDGSYQQRVSRRAGCAALVAVLAGDHPNFFAVALAGGTADSGHLVSLGRWCAVYWCTGILEGIRTGMVMLYRGVLYGVGRRKMDGCTDPASRCQTKDKLQDE